MVGIGSEGAETKSDVEAGFAEAAVAAVKLRRQGDVLRRRAIRVRDGLAGGELRRGWFTYLNGKQWPDDDRGIGRTRIREDQVRRAGGSMHEEVLRNAAI